MTTTNTTPNTVQGGKVWTPPQSSSQPASANSVSKKKIHPLGWVISSVGVLVLIVTTILLPAPLDITEKMTPSDWFELTEDGSHRIPMILTTWILLYPIYSTVITICTPMGNAKKVLATIAIFCIASSFTANAYQKGVVELDKEEVVSTWFVEEYNYQFIDIIDNESFGSSEDDISVLVIDLETGEEKTVKYFENNGQVYFAADETELVEQIKHKALDKG